MIKALLELKQKTVLIQIQIFKFKYLYWQILHEQNLPTCHLSKMQLTLVNYHPELTQSSV